MSFLNSLKINNIIHNQKEMGQQITALQAAAGLTGGYQSDLSLNGYKLLDTSSVQLLAADASLQELSLDINKNLSIDNNIILNNNNYSDYISYDNSNGWVLGNDITIDSDLNFSIAGTAPFNTTPTRTNQYYGIPCVGYATFTAGQNNIGIGFSKLPLKTSSPPSNSYGEWFIDYGVMANNSYFSPLVNGTYTPDVYNPPTYPINVTIIYDGEMTIKILFNNQVFTNFIFTVPKGEYVMTIGGFEGSILNPIFIPITPNTEPTDWATFPATESVNMSGNAITNCSSIFSPTVYLGTNNNGTGSNVLTALQQAGKNVMVYNTEAILTSTNYTDYISGGVTVSSSDGTLGVTTEGSDYDLSLNYTFKEDLNMNSNRIYNCSSLFTPNLYIGANNAGGNNTLTSLQTSGKNVLTYNTSPMLTAANYSDYISGATAGTISSSDGSLTVSYTGANADITYSNTLSGDLDCSNHALLESQYLHMKSNDGSIGSALKIDNEGGFLCIKRQSSDINNGSKVYDEIYNPLPSLAITEDLNMSNFKITNAASITADNVFSVHDFNGLGLSLPYSRVCNDGNKNLIVTRDGGITRGTIYDSVYNPPNVSGVYSTYINQSASKISASDGLYVTTANNVALITFNYGSVQATRSIFNISMFNMAFSVVANSAGFVPSSFMVTLTLGNVNSSTNIIGESINWGFTVVNPSTTQSNVYNLPTNVNIMLSNFSSASADMSFNLSVKGPPVTSGNEYDIFLTSFQVVGLLDAYDAPNLNPVITVTGLSAD